MSKMRSVKELKKIWEHLCDGENFSYKEFKKTFSHSSYKYPDDLFNFIEESPKKVEEILNETKEF